MAEPLQQALNALTRYMVGEATMGETLELVCAASLEAVTPASAAGVSMTVEGRVGTYVFTHPEIAAIDQVQYDNDDGPCVDAFTTGEVVHIRSLTAPGPYLTFRTVAARHGYHSVMSMPMIAVDTAVGALNFYSTDDDAFTVADEQAASAFATQAAFLLLNAQAYWDARVLSENLTAAMELRGVIEQAKGIIMATQHCTADEAFELLRRQSQHQNVKLRDLAVELTNAQHHRRHAG